MPIGFTAVAASTSTGNQSISGPAAMGTQTPKCVIIEAITHATAGAVQAGCCMARGAWDGTTVLSAVAASPDATTVISGINTSRRVSATAIIQVLTANTLAIDGEADPVSLDAGGVTITWTNPPATAIQLKVTFIWGPDWDVAVGGYAGDATVNNTVTISGLSFRPRGLLMWGAVIASGSSADAAFTAGVVAIEENGTVQGQNGWGWFEPTAPTVSTVQATTARSDSALHSLSGDPTTGAVSWLCSHQVTQGNSDGFVVKTIGGSSAMTGFYVALRNGLKRTWADIPTLGINTAGTKTVTPGFQPGHIFTLPTMVQVGNKDTTVGTASMGFGLGGDFVDNTRYTVTWSAEDAVTTSDTYQRSGTGTSGVGLNVTGSADWAASVSAKDATTFTFNVTNAAANDVLTGFLVFEGGLVTTETEDVTDAFVFKPGMTSADTENITDAFAFKPGVPIAETETITEGHVFRSFATLVIDEQELIDEEFVTPGFLANVIFVLTEEVDILESHSMFAPAVLVSTETVNITDGALLWLGNVLVSADLVEISDGFGGTRIVLRRGIPRARIDAGGAEEGIIYGPHSARGEVDG